MMRVWTLAVMAAVALGVGTAELRAQEGTGPTGSVTALSVVPTNGRAEVVLAIDGTVELKDFTLTGPHRVVLDVHGARLRLRPVGYDREMRGGIRNVRMAQNAADVVRIVLDLDGPRQYSVVRGASEIRVTVAGEDEQFAAWSVGTPRRGQVAGGSTGAEVVASAAPQQRAAAPARASIPPARATQPAAPPRTSFRSSSPASLASTQQQQQPRMTVTYTEMDVAEVIKFIAGFANRTIVVGADVKGTVTAEIHDQPWDVALQTILASRNLAATEDPKTGIILVDSYANILAKQALEPLETQLVKINYQTAPALVNTVQSLLSRDCGLGLAAAGGASAGAGNSRPGQSGCVMRGSVMADTATNALLITDVPSRIPEIVRFIQGLDVRTPLISIKAKIILVNRTDIEDIGISYDLGTQRQFFNRLVQRIDPTSYTPIDSDGDGIPDAIGGGEPFDQNVNIIDLGGNSLSALGNANQRVPNPALNLIFSTALGKFDLTAFIDALQEVRLADVQAEPSITVLDNHQARMFGGSEVPVRVIDAGTGGGGEGGGFPVATVEFREAGLVLDVIPQVTNDRRILMTLNAERSGVVEAASDVGFVIDRQQATSRVLVSDGETAVIGGFTITEVTVTKSGIPLLVDLPLIGKLFGRTLTREEKRELLVLVTPHILEDGDVVGSSPTRR